MQSCDNLIPPKCFEAAVKGCDTTTAATAAITMKLFGHVEQIAWCLLLLFMFLVIQVSCLARHILALLFLILALISCHLTPRVPTCFVTDAVQVVQMEV